MTNFVMRQGHLSTAEGPTTSQSHSSPTRFGAEVDRLGKPLVGSSSVDLGSELDWFSLSRIEEDPLDFDAEMIHLCLGRDNRKDLPEDGEPWM